MALQFVEPKVADLSVAVDVNASGNIAMSGETPAGSKIITIKGFKTAGTVTDASNIFTKILGTIGGASYSLSTANKKYNVAAKEVE